MLYGSIDAARGPAGSREGFCVVDCPLHHFVEYEDTAGEGNRRRLFQPFATSSRKHLAKWIIGITVLGQHLFR